MKKLSVCFPVNLSRINLCQNKYLSYLLSLFQNSFNLKRTCIFLWDFQLYLHVLCSLLGTTYMETNKKLHPGARLSSLSTAFSVKCTGFSLTQDIGSQIPKNLSGTL